MTLYASGAKVRAAHRAPPPTDRILIENEAATYALSLIAKGRKDCGRPIAAGVAQQIARETLVALGVDW